MMQLVRVETFSLTESAKRRTEPGGNYTTEVEYQSAIAHSITFSSISLSPNRSPA